MPVLRITASRILFMFIRAYIPQSAGDSIVKSRESLDAFAADLGLLIAARYVEREAGTCAQRFELFRLLSDCQIGDVLIVARINDLFGLTPTTWNKLRAEVDEKQVRIVARDIPTSWTLATPSDFFSKRMFKTVIDAMLDVIAAIAPLAADECQACLRDRKPSSGSNQHDRGRPENKARNAMLLSMLEEGKTWRTIIAETGCSRTLLARITRHRKSK
jgi:DNA invertase Pin-like site-specific DNA recombinase